MLAALQAWLKSISAVLVMDWGIVLLLLGLALYLTRNSRAVLLVRGFMILLVIYLLSRPLPLLHLVLDKLLVGSAVALGILFQPELRRLLEQLGRVSWFSAIPGTLGSKLRPEPQVLRDSGEEEIDYLEELVLAVKELSQNRTGALIVIELDQPIDARVFTDGGVPLQAQLSRELLQTIFQTSTLLHDGAVILHNNQIRSAGVILPMSERVASRQLGTRHRAAMGITEQTECLCIVVSEETGSISLAEAGRLERPLTSSKLRELLLQRLQLQQVPQTDLPLQLWPKLVSGLVQRFSRDLSTPWRKTLPKE